MTRNKLEYSIKDGKNEKLTRKIQYTYIHFKSFKQEKTDWGGGRGR